jgi:preprotein translocase subunit SecA
MIREVGRGTDFKCYDQALKNSGGVHVIQSFFSTDIAEEIQIKGRATCHI